METSSGGDDPGVDVDIVQLFSESLGEPGSGADTYLEILDTNTDRIVDALTDRPPDRAAAQPVDTRFGGAIASDACERRWTWMATCSTSTAVGSPRRGSR